MSEKNKIEKIKFPNKDFHWISINRPTEDTVEYLKRHYKFHPLDLDDCISHTQRSKIDDYDDYLFMFLHVPVKSSRQKQIRTSDLKIFISQNFLITIHNDDPTLKTIFENCQKKKKIKEEYMGKGTGYLLYMIIDDVFEAAFPLLDSLARSMDDIEKEVFDADHSKDRLKDILFLKKDLINFRRMIMPQRTIIAQLEHKNKKFLPANLDVYFDDVVDKVEKIWNNLENLHELVSSLQETNESIISHNTNNVIKILTVFSVIMLPLTFITGFYGMNVSGLPLAQTEWSIAYITAILFSVVFVMISFFKYKKWL